MNLTKRILVIGVIAMLLFSCSNEERMVPVDKRIARLKSNLNLTDEQSEKIKTVMLESQAKLKALHDQASESKESRMAEARVIRQSENDQIMEILNEEQQAKYRQLLEERGNRHRNAEEKK